MSELPDNLSPVMAEPAPVTAPAATSSGGDLLGPPDLPDITLSPTPLNRSPLSAVYLGWDRLHRCDVIVKVQRVTQDPVAMERFRREAAVMAQLRHPSIVSLYRFHEGDPASLVMEYVRGKTLAALVAGGGWLPSARVAAIVDSIAAALDSAHAVNIIHRDVKPANILLPKRGPARLTDFGVAHIEDDAPLTVMGDMLGTIEYASPEQVRGHETPDARSDVYSLAAVAYFALTGTPPFRAADESTQAQLSVMHRQVFAEPPPLRFHREDISPEVESVVLRGLAKAPEDRFQTAGHFAAAFHAAAQSETGTPEQNALAAASRRTGAMAGVLAAATLLLIGGGIWWKIHPARPAPPSPPQVAVQPQTPSAPVPRPVVVPKPVPPAVAVKAPAVKAPAVKAPVVVHTPRRAAPPVEIKAIKLKVKAAAVVPQVPVKKPRVIKQIPAVVHPAIPARPLSPRPQKPRIRKPLPVHPAPPRHITTPPPVPVFAAPAAHETPEPPPPHLRNP